jgi:hypothetical protein
MPVARHQRRGLQRVTGTLRSNVTARQPVQFAVDQGNRFLHGFRHS